MKHPSFLMIASLSIAACGGHGVATPTPISRPVTLVAFLDENRNGSLDGQERIRIPGAEVTYGSVTGRSSVPTGEVSLVVPPAAQPLSVAAGSLPPYYQGPEGSVTSPPQEGLLGVPIRLPLGDGAVPGVFLALGDSITNGQPGTGDGQGYTGILERKLAAYFGKATVINDGVDSSNSEKGDARILDSLGAGHPAFTLILYGTNDWADARCADTPCFTIDRLRSMVRKVKSRGGFPFVGTLLMTNVGNDFRASPQRNSWNEVQNGHIKDMAAEEGAVLVDLHAAFEHSPLTYNELFADYIHPSAAGYQVIADAWFDAITRRH
jgi:lysophospholipase L1-like esterase